MTAIHKYKQAMRWFTRPKIDPSIKQLAARDFYQGGRVQYKPGGLVEPGVMHYGRPLVELTKEQEKWFNKTHKNNPNSRFYKKIGRIRPWRVRDMIY